MKALVLGAAGFVGRAVVRDLTATGHEVVQADRDASATTRAIDVLDDGALGRLLTDVAPDAVFNLVGYGIDPAQRDGGLLAALNADFPGRLTRAVGRATLIHVGSGAEYGPVGGDLDEAGPAEPHTDYGRTKLAGTLAVVEAARETGARALVARLFTVYGPGERPRRLVPTLLAAARTDEPVYLSAGLQSRDFTYVADVAEGLRRLAGATWPPGTVVNLASGRLLRVRDAVLEAAGVLGIEPARLVFGAEGARDWEMAHDPLSLACLEALTGWRPATTFGAGISATLQSEDGARG